MSYVCTDPESYEGQAVGTGHCVVYVQKASGAPKAKEWKEGEKVRDSLLIQKGTAIATFVDGKYLNKPTGNHAAIYISQNDKSGIWVYDQWVGHPVEKRIIRFRGGHGTASNDGDAFSIIE